VRVFHNLPILEIYAENNRDLVESWREPHLGKEPLQISGFVLMFSEQVCCMILLDRFWSGKEVAVETVIAFLSGGRTG
jgi:hypothetical protein